MLRTMVEVFREAGALPPAGGWLEVQVQVLQTVSILLMNVRTQRCLCE